MKTVLIFLTMAFFFIGCGAVPEEDVDRTSASGKASSVQFVHFNLSETEIAEFKRNGAQVILGINHPKYSHSTILQEDTRVKLAKDFK